MCSIKKLIFVSLLFAVCVLPRGTLPEGNGFVGAQGQSLDKETSSDCIVIISEQYGSIHSPGYPDKYPRYSRCQYVIERFSPDVCEVKLTMERFDVAKMMFSNCSADFFEIQNEKKRYKLCGELPSGSKKFVFFPPDSDKLVFKFQSAFHQKRGFSIDIKQLPFSCKRDLNATHAQQRTKSRIFRTEIKQYSHMKQAPPCSVSLSGRIGRITLPDFTEDNVPMEKCSYHIKKSEARACLVQLDFSNFEVTETSGCETDYLKLPNGQKLCGTLGGARKLLQFPPGKDEIVLEYISNSEQTNSYDIQVTQLPGPCDYGEQSSNITDRSSQQCDSEIRGAKGRIISPGFPSPFGPNYKCTYRIFRPDPSVCQIELEFLTFGVGKHNPVSCTTGAFLELPGRNRLCHDINGKMIIKVPEFKDPVIILFQSDSQSSGKGFDIEIAQIMNTCPGYNANLMLPSLQQRCYQEVSSQFGLFTPPSSTWCEFVVRRFNPSVCQLRLQIAARSFFVPSCVNNFVHLPNGERMCISVTERRDIPFPEDLESLILVYFNRNNPEFHLYVEQISNSCKIEHRTKSRRWTWKINPRNMD